ncbi:MAG: hypothetical protein WC371_04015 [Parachlamydiales bacterium]
MLGKKIFFRHSGWILFLVFLFTSFYLVSFRHHNQEITVHQLKLNDLQKEREKISLENQDLKLRLNSHGDPAWIELILMRELGVVPEGRLKVHFTEQK